MVFDVARAVDLVAGPIAALELEEDRAQRLVHEIRKYVKSAAVCHAHYDLLDFVLGCAHVDLLERDHGRLAAVEAEAFGADVFLVQELFEAFGGGEALEDGGAMVG